MKKIFLLLFLMSGLSFSETCNWISDRPTLYEKMLINLVKEKKMTDKIYCDTDNERMIYQLINEDGFSDSLEIGLIYNKKERKNLTYKEILNYIVQFDEDVSKLDIIKNLSDREYDFSPKLYNYRMYIYFPEVDDIFMVMKNTMDLEKGKWEFYYSTDFFSKSDENDIEMIKFLEEENVNPTDDIIY